MLRAFLLAGRVCCVVAALIPVVQGRGGHAAEPAEPRLDLYGDPLPPGARARLGTVRFRHDSNLYGVAYSPDGTLIASCGDGHTVCVWEAETGKLVRRLLPGHDLIRAVEFSPDSKFLVAVGRNNPGPQLHLWDVATGELKQTFALGGNPDKDPYTVSYCPTGKLIAAGDVRGGVYVWDVVSGEQVVFKQLEDGVECVQFSHDGQFLAAGDSEGGLCVQSMSEKAEERFTKAHEVSVDSIAFTVDGRWLISGGYALKRFANNAAVFSGSVRFWSLPELEQNTELAINELGSAGGLAMSPKGDTLAIAERSEILLWDWKGRKQLKTLSPFHGGSYEHNRLSFSPDGISLAAASGWPNAAIRVWDTTTGRPRQNMDSHDSTVHFVHCFDDHRIITCSNDRTARSWNASSAECLGTIDRNVVGVSPDGSRLVCNDGVPVIRADSLLRIVDSKSQKTLDSLAIGERFVASTAFSNDGQMLACATYNRPSDRFEYGNREHAVRIWNLNSGNQTAAITSHNIDVRCLLFAPGARELAIIGWKGQVAIWDFRKEQIVRSFDATQGHKGVWSAALSPDESTLAVASSPGEVIRLTRIADGTLVREIPAPNVNIGLTYSPDGRWLVAAESHSHPG
jgi:WD40 repeat protein